MEDVEVVEPNSEVQFSTTTSMLSFVDGSVVALGAEHLIVQIFSHTHHRFQSIRCH